jgi:replication factor C small subunit
MDVNPNEYIWCQKYRPKRTSETILPAATKIAVDGFISQGRIPSMLLKGSAGTGKTTLAMALCEELGADYIIINASSESGIDTFRIRITQFASTMSFSDAKKVVILDEADSMSPQMQSALRAGMEAVSGNCSFILTCNFPSRIIEPIHSRCSFLDFQIPSSEKPLLAMQFFRRVCNILELEGIEYDKPVVIELVNKYFPDFRRCLNELQKYASSGRIDAGILVSVSEASFTELLETLKAKKFNSMRTWVVKNSDMDPNMLFRWFYDNAADVMQPKILPELIILINDYSFKSSQVMDQSINLAAFLTEVMSLNVEWK